MRSYPLTDNCTIIEICSSIRQTDLVLDELNKIISRLIKEGVPEIHIRIVK